MTAEREVTRSRTDSRYRASGVLSTGKRMWWASPWHPANGSAPPSRQGFLASVIEQLDGLRTRYGVTCGPLRVEVETRRTIDVIERAYRTRFDSEVTP